MKKILFCLTPIALSSFGIVSVSCNNKNANINNEQDDEKLFKTELDGSIKFENIIDKLSITELENLTPASLYILLSKGYVSLSLRDKEYLKYSLNLDKTDILFWWDKKKYSLNYYLNKVNDFDISKFKQYYAFIEENGLTYSDKSSFIITQNIDKWYEYNSLHNNITHYGLDYYFDEYSKQYSLDKSINKYLVPNLQYLIQYCFETKDKLFNYQTPNNEIRINGLIHSVFQRKLLFDRVIFLMNLYYFGDNMPEYAQIQSMKKQSNILSIFFNLEDSQRKVIYTKNINKNFYLTYFEPENFYSYNDLKTNKPLQINYDYTLFSEELNYPTLYFQNNPLGVDDFDSLMHKTNFRVNLNIFNMLAYLMHEKLRIDGVSDLFTYKIGEFSTTNLLNNSYAIGKFDIELKNKQDIVTKYPWYSINFTKHKHIFSEGFYLTDELGNIDKNDKSKYFSYYNNSRMFDSLGNLIVPNNVDPDAFLNQSFTDIVNHSIHQQVNNLELWKNNTMSNMSVFDVIKNKEFYEKYLSVIFSQYTLLYYIVKSNELIKYVKVSIDPNNDYSPEKYGLGNLPIEIDFIDHSGKSMLENKVRKLLTGFNGYDKKPFGEKMPEVKGYLNSAYVQKGKTLPYLIDFKVLM
ncbi:MAG3240 family lipoprotein [Mycoplasmopsis felifaucium]|uniref:Lipoprotein n=1 Tax=Mycoplasmopsis felifaucium TaxID=35768 RepID=A0ABZ2RR05_9BACT